MRPTVIVSATGRTHGSAAFNASPLPKACDVVGIIRMECSMCSNTSGYPTVLGAFEGVATTVLPCRLVQTTLNYVDIYGAQLQPKLPITSAVEDIYIRTYASQACKPPVSRFAAAFRKACIPEP